MGYLQRPLHSSYIWSLFTNVYSVSPGKSTLAFIIFTHTSIIFIIFSYILQYNILQLGQHWFFNYSLSCLSSKENLANLFSCISRIYFPFLAFKCLTHNWFPLNVILILEYLKGLHFQSFSFLCNNFVFVKDFSFFQQYFLLICWQFNPFVFFYILMQVNNNFLSAGNANKEITVITALLLLTAIFLGEQAANTLCMIIFGLILK